MQSNCGETKPGDEEAHMLFPWLTEERLFQPGTAPPLSTYQQFYDDVMSENLNKMMAIVSLHAELCVAFCEILVDLSYVFDIEGVRQDVEKCLETPVEEAPIIAIYCGLVWATDVRHIELDDELLARSTFKKTHKWITEPVPIANAHLHANMIIIDRISKTVERFEPNTIWLTGMAMIQADTDHAVVREIMPILGGDYSYCPPTSFCPKGPQKDNYCTAWSFFYLHLRVLNPHMSRREIVERLTEVDWGPDSLLIDYLEIMQNTFDALRSGSNIYSSSQKKRFTEWPRKNTRYQLSDNLHDMLEEGNESEYIRFLKRITEKYDEKEDVGTILYWLGFSQGKYIMTIQGERPRYMRGSSVVF